LSLQIQPKDIACNFTLEQIDARIAEILAAITAAEQSQIDQFSDGQASQKVQRQNLTELNNNLAIWLKARSLKTGCEGSKVELISAEYQGGNGI